MNLLALLPTALKTLAKVTGITLFEDASKAVSGLQVTPELQAAMAAHEREMAQIDTDALKAMLGESIAEIQSSDKYVSRARPTSLYAAVLITAAIAGAMIVGVKLDTGAIITVVAPLWGHAAWYTKLRTDEKVGNGK